MSELGDLLLLLSFASCICVIFLCCVLRGKIPLSTQLVFNYILWFANFIFAGSALLCLMYCYVTSDFSVINVINNSHTDKPLVYKIAGVWGNHEGSMLLLLFTISLFTLCFLYFGAKLNVRMILDSLAMQAFLIIFFIIFIKYVSNPFVRIFPAPINGFGLTPLLQDIGLTFHPPVLYMGYVGFSIPFSFAIAGMLNNSIDKVWCKIVRPWVLMPWVFLTLGITTGSWWAYRELGWGGYWFWDPVENVSLMPWLCATALLHSNIVFNNSNHLKSWSVLLSIMTFSVSLIGTFLVRSGLVTSVHSFAQDPKRGLFILLFFLTLTLGALLVYAIKVKHFSSKTKFSLISRESSILMNNILLMFATLVIIIGTFYPLIVQMIWGESIAVGPQYFNKIFAPLSIVLLILCSLGSSMRWCKDEIMTIIKKHGSNFITASIITVVFMMYFKIESISYEVLAILFAFFLIIGMIRALIKTKKNQYLYGMCIAHIGFGVIVLSIAINSLLQEELLKPMSQGDKVCLGNAEVMFKGLKYEKGPNYFTRIGEFAVSDHGKYVHMLYPEIRLFHLQKTQTTESATLNRLLYDIYITIGDAEKNVDGLDIVIVRLYYRPMMGWLWFGGLLLCIGGLYSVICAMKKGKIRSLHEISQNNEKNST